METILMHPAALYHATLESIMRAAVDGQIILPIVGDCMERAGIEDGGFIAVDFTRCPRPQREEDGVHVHGYPCLCYARAPGADKGIVMCKEYCGIWMGQMVGTRYDNWKGGDYRMDCAFPADAILGVVFAAWGSDGMLNWQHDPADYPTELPGSCTVKGGNAVVGSARKIGLRERRDTP